MTRPGVSPGAPARSLGMGHLRVAMATLLVVSSGCGARTYKQSAARSSYGGGGYAAETTAAAPSADYRVDGVNAGADEADDAEYVVAQADDTGGGGGTPAGPPPASGSQVQTAPREALVIEGWISMAVDDVSASVAAVRAEVDRRGGRLLSEELSGGERASWGVIRIRLPPGEAQPFLDWLEGRGEVEARRVQATDVSKTLVDYEVAIENHELTLARLGELVNREGVGMNEVLAIEREMTRIRGELERLKGEDRWLRDRVALATLEVRFTTKRGVVLGGPKAKFHPGPRFSTLILTAPGDLEQTRIGGGVTLHFQRSFTLELDIFDAPEGEQTAVLITAGGATYSDFLGRGLRSFLNPYLGLRLGYGHLEDSAFVIEGDVGLEIYKQRYVMLEAFGRGIAFIGGDGVEPAIQIGGALVIAF